MIAYLPISSCANVDTLNSDTEKENWTRKEQGRIVTP